MNSTYPIHKDTLFMEVIVNAAVHGLILKLLSNGSQYYCHKVVTKQRTVR